MDHLASHTDGQHKVSYFLKLVSFSLKFFYFIFFNPAEISGDSGLNSKLLPQGVCNSRREAELYSLTFKLFHLSSRWY